jgi:hypothetical protein
VQIKNQSSVFLTIFTFIFIFSTTFLVAATDKEMGTIINLAGKQRMLTQKVSKHALLIYNSIEVKKNKKELESSAKLFDKTMKGLMKGDKSLNLIAVPSKKVQTKLKEIDILWQDFYKDIKSLLKKPKDKKLITKIAKKNLPLLKNMHEAVTMIVEESGVNSNIKIDIANDINYAGKQRMLTQKISKELLLIKSDIDKEENIFNLKKTTDLFGYTINALIHGDKKFGLKGSKISHITEQLNQIQEQWTKIRPSINEKSVKDNSKIIEIINSLSSLLEKMNSTVNMYESSLKRQVMMSAITNIVDQVMDNENRINHEINLAGRQRMLTQKMSKEAILIALNVEPEKNRELLKKTSTLFNRTLNGFIEGDKTLGLTPATQTTLIDQVKKIKKSWGKFNNHIKSTIENEGLDKKALLYVIEENMPLLDESEELVRLYKKNRTHELSPIEKTLRNIIDLAGKQRMLSQKMTKEKILIIGGLKAKENGKLLLESVALFDKTLKGLINGDKKLGLPGVTNSDLKRQLLSVNSIWNELKPLYKKGNISNEELAVIIDKNVPLLKEMNRAVSMFEEISDY